jgi:hypothetical protein
MFIRSFCFLVNVWHAIIVKISEPVQGIKVIARIDICLQPVIDPVAIAIQRLLRGKAIKTFGRRIACILHALARTGAIQDATEVLTCGQILRKLNEVTLMQLAAPSNGFGAIRCSREVELNFALSIFRICSEAVFHKIA